MKKKTNIKISFVDSYSSQDVTGSNIFIKTPNYKILLDCGMHQSNDKKEDYLINSRKLKEYKPKDLDFIFISHLHQDHLGLLPKYYKEGFKGKTIISENSKDIMKDMLLDSAWICERDTEILNKQLNKNYTPLYTKDNINTTINNTLEYPIYEKIKLNDEISFELIPSGHLLTGTQIVLWITYNNITKCIGYTGDIGNNLVDNYYVNQLKYIDKCDLLIGESTYGDRKDLKVRPKQRKYDFNCLEEIIENQVIDEKGKLVIPVFAQSRCPSILSMIYELYKDRDLPCNVYIDSPLAIKLLNDYDKILNSEYFKKILNWNKLVLIKESEDSKALVSSNFPCIILSTSGMCNVGRIRHHFKSIVPNPNATILFCGYSNPNSLASIIKEGNNRKINIDGKMYKVKCDSQSLKSMSGHATYEVLFDYYSKINCSKIVLHHGSEKAKECLANDLRQNFEKQCKTTKVICANNSLKINL